MDIGNKIFEYGQTYVALSRVRSLNGLYLSFDYTKISANPKVKNFYNMIYKLNITNYIMKITYKITFTHFLITTELFVLLKLEEILIPKLDIL